MNFNILRHDTLDSTNTEAANQARLGVDEGVCVIARQQTAGRGRHGRNWVSEKDSGLSFSIVLRPEINMRYLPLITLMTGVAVYDTLKEFGLKPDIKWVNDVLIGEKKICGILAETVDTPRGLAVIVGIGVNLTNRNFPDEIAGTATSIEAVLSVPGAVAAVDVEPILTKYLSYWYATLNRENGPADLINEWRRRSTYFSGKHVRVTLANEAFEGITDCLEENGALRVIRSDGSVTIVQAGDIERLRSYKPRMHE